MAIYRGSGGSVEGITEADTVVIAVSQGGTGAKTAAQARTNLGLGTAATTNSSDYATAAQGALADTAVQSADIGTAAAEDTDYFATAAQGIRADSSLQPDDIGVSVQAYDAQLTDVAGLTPTDNGVIIGNGTNFVVESGSTLRSSLGLAIGTDVLAPNGSAASLTNFPTLNQNTTGTAANVSGVVAIANGGTGQTTATAARAALLPSYATNGGKVLAVKSDASDVEYISVGGSGTVTSVDMTVPTGLSVSGNPVTTTGTLAVTYASGYAIPTTAKQTEWDTAYTDRNKWDGGSTGLVAATGRTSLGVTATGSDTTYAYRANNLSDLASASTARTNLGLGTAATTAATDYATAAQGTKADNALTAANPSYTGTLTGGTGVIDIGSGQFYKDSSGIITGTAGNLMLVRGTAVTTTSGTTVDFTGIPSWVKKITVGFQNVSTAGTSSISIRLGTSGGIPTTGYQCGFATMAGTDGSTDIAFRVTSSSTAAQIANGFATLVNVSGNHWSGTSMITRYSSSGFVSACGITLGDTLTTVRVFLEAATTFDAGSINIFYE